MKKTIALLSFIAFTTAAFAQTTWTNDKAHSKLRFSITHMGISDVEGGFKNFEVKLVSAKDDFSDANVELTGDATSINTEVDMRDNHLKSADFFEVEKYPAFTFKSSTMKSLGNNKYALSGDLTMHGVTKPVTMNLLYRGTVTNPMSKQPNAGFQLTGVIKRSEFNIGSKYPAPMLSDEVQIKADGEFAKM